MIDKKPDISGTMDGARSVTLINAMINRMMVRVNANELLHSVQDGEDDLRSLKGGEVGYGTILVDYHCCGFDCRWLT